MDLVPLPNDIRKLCLETIEASILDRDVMAELFRRHRPVHVYHLAAVLSAKAEREPELAHDVNVDGTLGLFKLCQEFGAGPVRFLFPSSIAVYGLPDGETKTRQGAVAEVEWAVPQGMYGCNKLYCELVGSFLTRRRNTDEPGSVDFRAIRFPGLISSDTLPTSGTTDYAPAMIHAAAQGQLYSCFVDEDTQLPFMTMPDAVEALLTLALADPSRLTTRVYNIKGFSATAAAIRQQVLRHFPEARIEFDPDPAKQALVDTWPADVDDALARRDWGLSPRHGLAEAIEDYLMPALRRRYPSPKKVG
jgi:nucleoside-diphosphate-sugar epimerase